MPPKKEKSVEEEIKKLSKLEGNKTCADCGEKMPGYVNLTHFTFVCTKCSGIHREFQNKVKGISMSVFSMEDVKDLSSRGNLIHNAKYLARHNAREYPIPSSGADVARLKEFLKMKYIEKRWYSEDGPASETPPTRVGPSVVVPEPRKAPPAIETDSSPSEFSNSSSNPGQSSAAGKGGSLDLLDLLDALPAHPSTASNSTNADSFSGSSFTPIAGSHTPSNGFDFAIAPTPPTTPASSTKANHTPFSFPDFASPATQTFAFTQNHPIAPTPPTTPAGPVKSGNAFSFPDFGAPATQTFASQFNMVAPTPPSTPAAALTGGSPFQFPDFGSQLTQKLNAQSAGGNNDGFTSFSNTSSPGQPSHPSPPAPMPFIHLNPSSNTPVIPEAAPPRPQKANFSVFDEITPPPAPVPQQANPFDPRAKGPGQVPGGNPFGGPGPVPPPGYPYGPPPPGPGHPYPGAYPGGPYGYPPQPGYGPVPPGNPFLQHPGAPPPPRPPYGGPPPGVPPYPAPPAPAPAPDPFAAVGGLGWGGVTGTQAPHTSAPSHNESSSAPPNASANPFDLF